MDRYVRQLQEANEKLRVAEDALHKQMSNRLLVSEFKLNFDITRTWLKQSRRAVFRSPHSLQTHPCAVTQQPATGSASQLVHVYVSTFVTHHQWITTPRKDGWLSWPCLLTDSGRITRNVVTRPAVRVGFL